MSAEKTKTGAKCPLCKRPADSEYRPFCSRGCRDRDLLSWFGEGYRMPGARVAASDLDDTEKEDR